jgi:hypothetical protein
VGQEAGDRDAFFAECVQRWATQIGIASDGIDPEALPLVFAQAPVMK